jgi:hypothetical protein
MKTAIEFAFVFLGAVLLVGALGMLSLFTASVLRRIVPSVRPTCSRCIDGWKTRRGLRNRLLLTPLGITLAFFTTLGVSALPGTYRVRNSIVDSNRLVVRSGGNCCREPAREKVLFETTDERAIRAFSERISLARGAFTWRCKCCGDMTFDIYRDTTLRYSFSLHHGKTIRVKGESGGDRELSTWSRAKLRGWLEQTGINASLAGIWAEDAQSHGALRQVTKVEKQEETRDAAQPSAGPNAP